MTVPPAGRQGSGSARDPGVTFNSAHDLGNISRGNRNWNDFAGSSDVNDYYRFELSENGNFHLRLNGLSSDLDVSLFDRSGNFITSSTRSGSTSESIDNFLQAGTYYARVYPYSGSSSYKLRPENRIGPHNQWLETLAGQGFVGFCSLAAMIWYPLCVKRYRNQVVVLAQIGCTTLGMVTDSTLEVQLGLNFFAFFGFFTLTQYGTGPAESKPAVEIHPHQPVR